MSSSTPNALLSMPAVSVVAESIRVFDLLGYSYAERATLLPTLTSIFTQCGGWVLDRKTTSPAAVEFTLEVQMRAVLELYGALVGAGVELTRQAHTTLLTLCTCRQHRDSGVRRNEVLTLRLEITFLEDVTLHSLLMTGSGLA